MSALELSHAIILLAWPYGRLSGRLPSVPCGRQPGTRKTSGREEYARSAWAKPFHLKAVIRLLTSSPAADPNQAGTVEIWWLSSGQWRREIRTPKFNQTEIVSAGKDWQQNDTDYFPEWLREAAVCLVKPVPALPYVLARVRNAQVQNALGSIHMSWVDIGSDGTMPKGIGAGIYLAEDGSFSGGSGVGWSCYFDQARNQPKLLDFHGRSLARRTEGKVVAEVSVDPGSLRPRCDRVG